MKGSTVARSDRQYSVDECSDDEEACVQFVQDDLSLILRSDLSRASSTISSTLSLNASGTGVTVGICLDLEDGVQWFGGPEVKYQLWPVQDAQWNYTYYHSKEDDAVAIAEPYWVSSDGTYLYVNPNSSLFLGESIGSRKKLMIETRAGQQ